MRKVAEKTQGDITLRVYRDPSWDEYIVKFYINGVLQVDANYYTSDKDDAIMMLDNAQNFIAGGN